jgi:hypothetical protein
LKREVARGVLKIVRKEREGKERGKKSRRDAY